MNNQVKNANTNDNYLIYGDSLEVMKTMIEKNIKVDLLITDPPYNISRKHQLGFSNMGRAGMNYGEWDYDFDQLKWLETALRLISENGSIIIFNDWKNMGAISNFISKNGFDIKDLIRWEKSNPMPRNVERRYVSDAEYAIWATKKGGKWIFNKSSKNSYLRPQIITPIMAGSSKDKIHPTQKPQKLMEKLIEIHSNVSDTILDPFAGSGSTGLAALKLNRKFILIEKDKNYYEKSKERFDKIATSL